MQLSSVGDITYCLVSMATRTRGRGLGDGETYPVTTVASFLQKP